MCGFARDSYTVCSYEMWQWSGVHSEVEFLQYIREIADWRVTSHWRTVSSSMDGEGGVVQSRLVAYYTSYDYMYSATMDTSWQSNSARWQESTQARLRREPLT